MDRSTWSPASRQRLYPLLVFALAATVAGVGSGAVSLWTDEAITISAGTRSWDQLWNLLGRVDAVHGLYYGFMVVWIDLFGVSEVALRLPSALAAGGTALGVLVVARRLATPGTALTAALLCAVLPRLTWAGIEARPFVFSALAAVWATWAFLVASEKGGAWRWGRYATLSVVGVLSNIYLVMLVMGHGVTLLVFRRDRRSMLAYLAAASSTALVTLPVLLLVQSQQAQLGTGIGADRSVTYIARRILINQVFLGETPSDGVLSPWVEVAWQGAAVVAAFTGVAVVAAALVLPARRGDDKAELLAVAVPWIVLPTLLVAVYAVLVSPIYQPRYFTFTVPAVALLLALGFRALARQWVALSGLALLVAAVSVVYVSQRLPYSKPFGDWARAADVVASCSSQGDAVLFEPRTVGDVVTRTTRRVAYAYPQAFADLDDLTLRETGADSGTLDGYSVSLASACDRLVNHETVWVVYGVNDPVEVISADSRVLAAEGFAAAGRWQGPSTTVTEYVRDTVATENDRPADCPMS